MTHTEQDKELREALYILLKTDPRADTYVIPYRVMDIFVDFITADRKRVALEAVKAYEDDLLSTIDDISNKPWRAARHIRELYENTDSGISDWYKEVADDWGLLEEFFSNGGMSKVRELMADPKFNVNYPERIAELKAQQEEL